MKPEKYDFCGYATKNDVKCSDGRIICRDAFKDDSGKTVPLLYQHLHDDPSNVLGHAVLENREDGVYAYCTFNNSEKAQIVKELVRHKDLDSLSIFANRLKQTGERVVHGVIRELSIVLAGANPKATIENISLAHADGSPAGELEDEAIIKANIILDESENDIEHADSDESKTVGEVFNTLTDVQKEAVYSMLLDVAGGDGKIEHSDEGGEDMKENVFENDEKDVKTTLSHDAIKSILQDARESKASSLKEVFMANEGADKFLSHAATEQMPHGEPGVDYGIKDIEFLFPEYRAIRNEPDMIKRDDAWVAGVIAGTSKTPFSRIKTMTVDVTDDAARARGYKKGHLKKEEVIKLAKRVTGPTTIYKKQRLDRDDIIDITDFDVVAWLKREMQMMLREELARAILLGDGRDASSDDKINEENIRPIYKENEAYAYHVTVDLGDEDNAAYISLIDQIAASMLDYKGSGSPTLYTTKKHHFKMKRVKDQLGRRLYNSEADLLDELGVSKIVEVELMEGVKDSDKSKDLVGIIVDLKDYTVGTNRGGQTTFFDDFDIDFNQYVYLYETRLSGALTRLDSAVIIEANSKD